VNNAIGLGRDALASLDPNKSLEMVDNAIANLPYESNKSLIYTSRGHDCY